jgi:ribosomal protein S18 acetylase RimI-like enzyme
MYGRFVRSASAADAPAIAEIHVKTWQFAYRLLLPATLLDSLSVPGRATWWRQQISTPSSAMAVFVGGHNGVVAGFCSVGKSEDDDAGRLTGQLYTLYVRPEDMGRGIGGELLGVGLAWLRNAGFCEATLWVLSGNTRARIFYEKHGWRPDGTVKSEEFQSLKVEERRYAIQLHPTT